MSGFLAGVDASDEALRRQALCADFLHREAAMLDDWRFDDWLDLLTDDIVYTMPVGITKEDVSDEFTNEAYYLDEDRNSLETRVDRLHSDFVWSEVPRSHTRRFVSNVRVVDEDGAEATVRDNSLFNFVREHKQVMMTYERESTLRNVDGALRLAGRTVYLDDSELPTQLVHFL